MTISEVVVASVVLSLSAQLGSQSWTATARAADRTASETALAVQLDQQVLASQRLLTAGEGTGLLLQEGQSCRLDPVAIDQLLDDALPARCSYSKYTPRTRGSFSRASIAGVAVAAEPS